METKSEKGQRKSKQKGEREKVIMPAEKEKKHMRRQ